MALTPDDIERQRFTITPTGYDRAEVDAFLVETAASLRGLPRPRPTMVPRLPTRAPQTNGASPVDTAAAPSAEVGSPRIATAHVASEVANILDAAQQAGATMLAEAENDAARVRASAERDAAQAREAAEQDRERVKRLLLRSEEQAASIIAQAEHQAHQQLAIAEREAVRRTRETLARTKRRTDELQQAERAAIDALRQLRAQLDLALDDHPEGLGARGGGADDDGPGASSDIIDIRSPSELDPDATLAPPDPTTRLIRAAVSRAANSGAATRT